MTLTIGNGPFGHEPRGVFNFEMEARNVIYFEDSYPWVRVEFGGELVADSKRMKLLHETKHLPVYYFPVDDVRWDLLEPSSRRTHCPLKGEAHYWTVHVGDRVAENAVWRYPEPKEGCPPIAGYVAFVWHSMDAWYEEDERVFAHPRDPYTRVDVHASSRHVRVRVGGEPAAESERPKILFESGLPPRLYLPAQDVRTDLLERSDTVTQCPYKGTSTYWTFHGQRGRVTDVAWSYAEPQPEAAAIADHLCFLGEHVELEVDGELW